MKLASSCSWWAFIKLISSFYQICQQIISGYEASRHEEAGERRDDYWIRIIFSTACTLHWPPDSAVSGPPRPHLWGSLLEGWSLTEDIWWITDNEIIISSDFTTITEQHQPFSDQSGYTVWDQDFQNTIPTYTQQCTAKYFYINT